MRRIMSRSTIVVRIVLITLVFLLGTAAADTRPNRVAIIPFAVHADRDMTFLRDGITDMLTSRLSWEKKVQVIGREQTAVAVKSATGPINELQAQMIGAKLEADFVLFGSLTIFADSVSIDAKLVDVSGVKPTLAFFNQAQGMGQVIPQINRFATDINTTVFGRNAPAPPVALQPAAPGAAIGTMAAGRQTAPQPPAADIYANPEKLAEGGFRPEGATAPLAGSPLGDTQVSIPEAPIGSAFVQPNVQETQASYWKSRTLKMRLLGISLGDIDKDGRVEIVMADEHAVDVYRMVQGRFQRAYPTMDMGTGQVIGVDVGDIDGNGYAEIYVSSLNARRNIAESKVFEFKGNGISPIIEKTQYCFRIVKTAFRGEILLGQEIEPFGDPWDKPIEEMGWTGGDLQPQTPLLPGGKANVLGITYNDIQNTGTEDAVAVFSRYDDLQIMSIAGQELWKSPEKYGGSELYFIKEQETANDENRQWLPLRILSTDIDGNGTVEVICIQNSDLMKRALARQRKFNEGIVTGMSWDGSRLIPTWKSRRLEGQISDIAVGDIDNDGRPELVLSIITKQGLVIGTDPSSAVIAYDLK